MYVTVADPNRPASESSRGELANVEDVAVFEGPKVGGGKREQSSANVFMRLREDRAPRDYRPQCTSDRNRWTPPSHIDILFVWRVLLRGAAHKWCAGFWTRSRVGPILSSGGVLTLLLVTDKAP